MASSFHYFADRAEAGKRLAEALVGYTGRTDVLVLALPRGGVPVAYEVAQTLAVPMDLWPALKLGVPGQEELAMGAIGRKRYLRPQLRHHRRLEYRQDYDRRCNSKGTGGTGKGVTGFTVKAGRHPILKERQS